MAKKLKKGVSKHVGETNEKLRREEEISVPSFVADTNEKSVIGLQEDDLQDNMLWCVLQMIESLKKTNEDVNEIKKRIIVLTETLDS
jgi:hypothetical protein